MLYCLRSSHPKNHTVHRIAFIILLFSVVLRAAETPLVEDNSWPFAVPHDHFTEDALLDLRHLNERQSGQHGFVRLSKDRNDFVRGDGKSLRFWAVGTDAWKFSPEAMERHARWLAKLGVNLTRIHVTVCEAKEGAQITDLRENVIAGVHRFIKAAKDAGIYVLISPYYPHFTLPKSWKIEGGGSDAEGLLFLDPKVQAAYRHWTRAFYTRVNPHTGLAIKDDPTVAILQVHNEDSLFFWTAQRLTDPQRRRLSAHFSDWLTQKYGSTQMAWTAWGDGWKGKDPLDDPGNGMIGTLKVYDLTQDSDSPAYTKRLNDTARFLAEYQHQFYAQIGRYLRDDLGCKQLLNATNWRTANDSRLKALERYSYQALDIDAENEYVGSDYQHAGNNANYRIDPGHHLVNDSVLSKPFEMCTNYRMEEGHPFMLTETAWKNPNRYQSEGPFLVAAYQSLNGLDAVCWFSCQTPGYEENPLKSFWPVGSDFATHKWNHCYPAMMAGFPANALLYRRGYLEQAKPIVRDVRSFESIFTRQSPRLDDNEAYGDQRQLPDLEPGWQPTGNQINRVAYQIGPVMTQTGGDPEDSKVGDLSQFFDPVAGTIQSATGELLWNYRSRICTMDSPKAQGVTGFLKQAGGVFAFTDLTIESDNPYAAINVVSLDGRAIKEARRVLIQMVTENRLTGWQTKDARFKVGRGKNAYAVDGEQILSTGQPPFRIANTQVEIRFKHRHFTKATILDINGYPVTEMAIQNGRLRLPPTAIYVIAKP